ncbi:MAG: ATP-binding protein [Candidatus Izemoplasmataceae bacterium]
MKLLRLTMKGFGKFKDKTLELSDGLNLVYGLNESGKSTIHAFIEGMFYGFIDGTKKRRTFTAEHEKYRPREGAYFGTLEFEHEKKAYRLERNFDKKNTEVRLFEMESGRDITADHPEHPVRKEIDLARFLDMPRNLFRNTLSIGQMNVKTDESARSELLRRLQNITQTKSEAFSISKALGLIDEKTKAIGSDTARTKPYFKTKEAIQSLEEEYQAAKEAHEATLEEKNRLDAIHQEDETLKNELRHYEEELKRIENSKRLERYRAIEDKLTDIKKALEESTDEPPRITMQFLSRAFDDYTDQFKRLEAARESVLDKVSRLDSAMERAPEAGSTLEKTSFETIEADYKRFKTFEKNLNTAEQSIKDHEKALQAESESLEALKTKREAFKKRSLIALIVLFPLFLIIGIVMHVKLKKMDTAIADLERKVKTLKTDHDHAMKNAAIAAEQIEKLTHEYGLSDPDRFDAFYYEAKHKKGAQAQKATLEAELETLKEDFKPLLSRFNLPKAIASLRQAFNALMRIKHAFESIKSDLDGEDYETLRASIDFQMKPGEKSREPSIMEAIRSVKKSLQDNALERTRKEESIASKERHHRPLSTIEYDLSKKGEALMRFEREKRILKNAEDRLKKVQKTIEDQFAPVMNENTEQYLKKLTGNTYGSIKMKKDLSFNVLASQTGRLEDASFFSAGTLDQIYIAMRLGILKTLKKDDYPLFMDDPFVQFDIERLKEALKLMDTIQEDRQVLLFTCHEREAATLERLKLPYAFHTLD